MGSHYSHLNLEERRKIAKWIAAKNADVRDCGSVGPGRLDDLP